MQPLGRAVMFPSASSTDAVTVFVVEVSAAFFALEAVVAEPLGRRAGEEIEEGRATRAVEARFEAGERDGGGVFDIVEAARVGAAAYEEAECAANRLGDEPVEAVAPIFDERRGPLATSRRCVTTWTHSTEQCFSS